ncbi:hypothetical protein DVH05_026048 [Phytophthora capsici]|nr:hypothetical protein DVH05_026048 [Phytophthora capsici]
MEHEKKASREELIPPILLMEHEKKASRRGYYPATSEGSHPDLYSIWNQDSLEDVAATGSATNANALELPALRLHGPENHAATCAPGGEGRLQGNCADVGCSSGCQPRNHFSIPMYLAIAMSWSP